MAETILVPKEGDVEMNDPNEVQREGPNASTATPPKTRSPSPQIRPTIEASPPISTTPSHVPESSTKDKALVESEIQALNDAFASASREAANAATRNNWRKAVIGDKKVESHLVRAILKHSKNRDEILENIILERDTELLTMASQKFLDKALALRLTSISAPDLVAALAKAGRLGFDRDDYVDDQEGVMPIVRPLDGVPEIRNMSTDHVMRSPSFNPPGAHDTDALLRLQHQNAMAQAHSMSQQAAQQAAEQAARQASNPLSASKLPDRSRADTPKFQCPHCGKSFTQSGGLNYHTMNKVCQRPEPPIHTGTGKLKPVCSRCNRNFTTNAGLRSHQENNVCIRNGDGLAESPLFQRPAGQPNTYNHPQAPQSQAPPNGPGASQYLNQYRTGPLLPSQQSPHEPNSSSAPLRPGHTLPLPHPQQQGQPQYQRGGTVVSMNSESPREQPPMAGLHQPGGVRVDLTQDSPREQPSFQPVNGSPLNLPRPPLDAARRHSNEHHGHPEPIRYPPQSDIAYQTRPTPMTTPYLNRVINAQDGPVPGHGPPPIVGRYSPLGSQGRNPLPQSAPGVGRTSLPANGIHTPQQNGVPIVVSGFKPANSGISSTPASGPRGKVITPASDQRVMPEDLDPVKRAAMEADLAEEARRLQAKIDDLDRNDSDFEATAQKFRLTSATRASNIRKQYGVRLRIRGPNKSTLEKHGIDSPSTSRDNSRSATIRRTLGVNQASQIHDAPHGGTPDAKRRKVTPQASRAVSVGASGPESLEVTESAASPPFIELDPVDPEVAARALSIQERNKYRSPKQSPTLPHKPIRTEPQTRSASSRQAAPTPAVMAFTAINKSGTATGAATQQKKPINVDTDSDGRKEVVEVSDSSSDDDGDIPAQIDRPLRSRPTK